jgi:hypothetical protein
MVVGRGLETGSAVTLLLDHFLQCILLHPKFSGFVTVNLIFTRGNLTSHKGLFILASLSRTCCGFALSNIHPAQSGHQRIFGDILQH